jgi:hypothetical protein
LYPFHRKGGGGVNISTLKYHVDVHYPKPNVDKGMQSVSVGQQTLTSFMSQKRTVGVIGVTSILAAAPRTPSLQPLLGVAEGSTTSTSLSEVEVVHSDVITPCYGVHFSDMKLPLNVRIMKFALCVYVP